MMHQNSKEQTVTKSLHLCRSCILHMQPRIPVYPAMPLLACPVVRCFAVLSPLVNHNGSCGDGYSLAPLVFRKMLIFLCYYVCFFLKDLSILNFSIPKKCMNEYTRVWFSTADFLENKQQENYVKHEVSWSVMFVMWICEYVSVRKKQVQEGET